MISRKPIGTITTTLDGRMERVNVCPAAEVRNLEADYAKLESENRQLRELLNDVIEERR